MGKQIQLKSPAKVNLFLEVVGKRSDGYHELETIFQEIDLCDEITIRGLREEHIEISSDSVDIPQDERNLAYRAASLFFQETGIRPGVHIHISKKIPVAAGLGGGSSNAATTLRGLQKFFERELREQVCFKLARSLGADVPFFLKGGTAKGVGIGDILEPLVRKESFSLVLVNPGFEVQTAQIYQQLKLGYKVNSGAKDVIRALREGDVGQLGASLFNRLEDVVLPRFSRLFEIKQQLRERGVLGVLLSGSGPTLYAILRDYDEAERVKNNLADLNYWTATCQAV